ncbi:hypothetical protein [Bosea sp. 117]|uniref:hypothetical protein n=1 Tax=Bosea sp. 117 TaxID=1125973 RepID=UPI000494D962|nr:hypothetical protein [Bosea sp. 117]
MLVPTRLAAQAAVEIQADPADVWLTLGAVVFASLLLGALRWWLALLVLPLVIMMAAGIWAELGDTLRELSTTADLGIVGVLQFGLAATACFLAPPTIALVMRRIYTQRMQSRRTHLEKSDPQI